MKTRQGSLILVADPPQQNSTTSENLKYCHKDEEEKGAADGLNSCRYPFFSLQHCRATIFYFFFARVILAITIIYNKE